VDEDSPVDPQSPYRRTKAVCEAMFADIAGVPFLVTGTDYPTRDGSGIRD
jgi:UDP-glucose 4-epimerase